MSVSVVIPCYNREEILPRAIQTAFRQTVPPDEIVVVDDGSSDRSVAVARRFGHRVRVIEQANAGAAAARNRGIAAARGDWIAFLDSDDEWDPEKIELQLSAAEKFPDAMLVFCDTLVRDEARVRMPSRFAQGGLYGAECEADGNLALYDRDLFTRMLTQSRVITSAVLVRRELPELHFPEDIWGSEDWALWLTLALRYPFASIDRVLVTMHQQGDNISGRKGKLYRNDVKTLEALAADPVLTCQERSLVRSALRQRRVGATYHSLVRGETREARSLLEEMPVEDLGWRRYHLYRLLAWLPPVIARGIASMRLASAHNG